MSTPQQLGDKFLALFNARDLDEMLHLVDEDVRYNGRHGDGEGIHLIREWIGRANTTMVPQRWFGDGVVAVAEVAVEWRSSKTQEVTDSAVWAISFASNDSRITSISRYADVGEAVTKMGLHEVDAITEAGFPDSSGGENGGTEIA